VRKMKARSGQFLSSHALGWSAFGLVGSWFVWTTIANLARHIRYEDQLIVLRYARNLVEGNGLVYNLGERVQGFTTPLFTLLSTGAVAFGGDNAATWQNALGVICAAGTAFLAVRVLSRAGAAGAAPLAVAIILYFSAADVSVVYLGMEVHLFALLFLLALDLHVTNRSVLAAVVTGLLFLTRPEGVLLSALLFGHYWSTRRRPPYREAIAALLTVLPWLLFATVYYGSPVTTTLGAKRGLYSPWEYLVGVAVYQGKKLEALNGIWTGGWQPSTSGSLASLLMTVVPAAVAVAGAVVLLRRRPQLWPLLAFPLACVAGYAVISPPLLHRWHYYFLNVVAAILVSAGVHAGLAAIAASVRGRLRRPRRADRSLLSNDGAVAAAWTGTAALAIPVLLAMATSLARAPERLAQRVDPRSLPGPWLGARYDPSTTIYAEEIGFLGWQSRLQVIDGAGLVTPGVRQDINRFDVLDEYLPDLVLLHTLQDNPLYRPWMYRRMDDFDAAPDYSLYSRVDPEFQYDIERDRRGLVAAFLRRTAEGQAEVPLRIPVVGDADLLGHLDSVAPSERKREATAGVFALNGWAADTDLPAVAHTVVAVLGTNTANGIVGLPRRPDVAAAIGRQYEYSGFSLEVPADPERVEREGFSVYAISGRDVATRLPFSYLPLIRTGDNEVLPTTDGRSLAVRPVAGQLLGAVDQVQTSENGTLISGWAADLERGQRPRQVVVYRDGEFLLALGLNQERPEILAGAESRPSRIGFRGRLPRPLDPEESFAERHRVFAVLLRGTALELPVRP